MNLILFYVMSSNTFNGLNRKHITSHINLVSLNDLFYRFANFIKSLVRTSHFYGC